MSSSRLPAITTLPNLSAVERATILDALFEPCTALHTLSIDLLHTTTFDSYNDLVASVGVQLMNLSENASKSDNEWLDKILGAHPRLGAKMVDSAQSQAEQAQLNTGGEEEATQLRELNEEYEKVFPGLRYVYDELSRISEGGNHDLKLVRYWRLPDKILSPIGFSFGMARWQSWYTDPYPT